MEEIIKELTEIGNELNSRFGTDSYEIRCKLRDIRDKIELLIPKKPCDGKCDKKNWELKSGNVMCRNCGKLIKKLK